MTRTTTLALAAAAFMLGGASLEAQDLTRYRDFKLGSTVASVEKLSGVTADDVKMIHQRPATIQELRWRPTQRFSESMVPTEPVREVVFSFYNDQLFQIVVDYDRQRTEGLTDADLIESIGVRYGVPALKATVLQTTAPGSGHAPPDGDAVVARWSDADASLTLTRGTYPTSLRLVLSLKTVEALARNASVEALQQDKQEAPQREVDRLKRITEEGRVAEEKARITNKPLFKP
jgi:hypothetical protein